MGALDIDPTKAATLHQSKELEMAFRRSNRQLRREAYQNPQAGLKRIDLLLKARDEGIDPSNFGSSEQRGQARESQYYNMQREASLQEADSMRSLSMAHGQLNSQMDDFLKAHGTDPNSYTPEARAEFHGLRLEASMLPGFQRVSGYQQPAAGAGKPGTATQGQQPAEAAGALAQKKDPVPSVTPTSQSVTPGAGATDDAATNGRTHTTLKDIASAEERKKRQQAAVDKLLARSKQLEFEHANPTSFKSGASPGTGQFEAFGGKQVGENFLRRTNAEQDDELRQFQKDRGPSFVDNTPDQKEETVRTIAGMPAGQQKEWLVKNDPYGLVGARVAARQKAQAATSFRGEPIRSPVVDAIANFQVNQGAREELPVSETPRGLPSMMPFMAKEASQRELDSFKVGKEKFDAFLKGLQVPKDPVYKDPTLLDSLNNTTSARYLNRLAETSSTHAKAWDTYWNKRNTTRKALLGY